MIAFLTILGYSLYDTIVVFDRARENSAALGRSGRMTYTRHHEPVAEPGAHALGEHARRRRSCRSSRCCSSAPPPRRETLEEFALALLVGLDRPAPTRRSSSPPRRGAGSRSGSPSTGLRRRRPRGTARPPADAASRRPSGAGAGRPTTPTADGDRQATPAAGADRPDPGPARPRAPPCRPDPRKKGQAAVAREQLVRWAAWRRHGPS